MIVEHLSRYVLAQEFAKVMEALAKPDVDEAERILMDVHDRWGHDAYEYVCRLIHQRLGIPPKDVPR